MLLIVLLISAARATVRTRDGRGETIVIHGIERDVASTVRKPQVGRSSRRNREGPSDDAQGLLVPGS